MTIVLVTPPALGVPPATASVVSRLSASPPANGPTEPPRNEALDASRYAGGGTGTSADPYRGWEEVVQAAADAVAGNAAVYPHARIHFPAGVYVTPTSGLFSDVAFDRSASLRGLHVTGDGWWNSILRLDTSANEEVWFFDNYTGGDHENSWQFATFTDLAFHGSEPFRRGYPEISDHAKGFRIHSTGQEQGYVFTRCDFEMLHTGFEFHGTNTASEMKFIASKIRKIKSTVYYLDNPQSVNHEFLSTDIESVYGDVFVLGAGGGSIKVLGGSLISSSEAATDIHWVRALGGGSTIGASAGLLEFHGVRFELRGDHTNLVRAPDLRDGNLHVQYTNCTFWNTSTRPKRAVEIGGFKVVRFLGCNFVDANPAGKLLYRFSGTNRKGQPGRIDWLFSQVPDDLSERIAWDDPRYGTASARGCYGGIGGTSGEPHKRAIDFDLNWNSSGQTDLVGSLKTAVIKFDYEPFPYHANGAFTEWTLQLPSHAVIMNIRIYKDSTNGVAADYRLHVGNGDKSRVYGSSAATTQNAAHRIILENLFVDVGTTAGDRIVRLWATGSAAASTIVTGGYATVDYY